jgi:hypothetical protein
VISPEQRHEVERLFREAGYGEPVTIAPVTSEDERVFVLTPGSGLAGRRDLEAALQAALSRKVWTVDQSESWPNREPLR